MVVLFLNRPQAPSIRRIVQSLAKASPMQPDNIVAQLRKELLILHKN
jgi:hypothetical protein